MRVGSSLLLGAVLAACGLDLVGTGPAVAPPADIEAATVGPSEAGPSPVATDGESAPRDALPDTAIVEPPETSTPRCPADPAVCEVVTAATVLDVAVAGSALLWLDSSGAIMTSALDGANPRAIVTGEAAPLAGIEANATHVFWTAGGQIRRAPRDGATGPTTIAPGAGGCMRWREGASLFLAVPSGSRVVLVDTANNTAGTIVENSLEPWGVAPIGPSFFVYTNYDTTMGRVRSTASVVLGAYATIAEAQRGPRCMVSDGTSVWWANRDSGTVMRSATSGAGAAPVLTGQTLINGLATDGPHLYWSWQSGIRRRSK